VVPRARESAPSTPLAPVERERFERLVLVHLDAAFNLARHLVRDADDAADAVQEACVRAMRHFGGFRGDHGRAWLLAITRNTCRDLLERRRTRNAMNEFDEELHSPAPATATPAPEADLDRTLVAEAVRRAVDALPFVFREAIVLRELEGLSYREIAEVAGVPVGTVMSRLARARAQLERRLTEGGGA
jgi:RNA polymerase sigma-70 factor, ECF subfamily